MPVIGVMRRGGHIQCSAPCHALSAVLTLSQWRIPSRKEKKRGHGPPLVDIGVIVK